MPYKARLRHANCWLWEKSGNYYAEEVGGWPDPLNGDYLNEYERRQD